MRRILLSLSLLAALPALAQDEMTPELLWSLKRVSANELSTSGKTLYYSVKQVDWKTEKSTVKQYRMNLSTEGGKEVSYKAGLSVIQRNGNTWYALDNGKLARSEDRGGSWKVIYSNLDGANDIRISPDGKHIAYSKEVLVRKVDGTDLYPDLPNTTAKVYRDLNYRHWDTWEDGKYAHIFIGPISDDRAVVDIMGNEPYDAPQKPFGGAEDFVWSPDSKGLLYVSKKKEGKEYAQSTNTDLYYYELATRETINWTANMMGYDTNPSFSPDGRRVAWSSMKRDGYESDKTDIYVMDLDRKSMNKLNLTAGWDGAVNDFVWSRDGNRIFYNAAWRGTVQLFEVNVPQNLHVRMMPVVRQITEGIFDVNGVVGQAANGSVIITRTDMNHAAEIFEVDVQNGNMRALTHENAAVYDRITPSETKLRMVKTSDGRSMGVWVVYPPDFDPKKKYPTLLYCQGGPQSALSQFYSIRWNFQLMAAKGYIVVAPNRRGMPGWGTKWNEDISKDWGGQPMRDYLAAIDDVAKEPYVDSKRLGCVGASYGGYSVFMLAGIHGNRFKSFIAHDGLYDLKSWYGTTEELWFANWDIGGNYWDKELPKSYEKYDPSNFVGKWNAPIMIIQGGLDFRVPIEQGLEAFQAAQLRGIKSKLLYLPNENHWVLHPHNGIAWQREFFSWLEETL